MKNKSILFVILFVVFSVNISCTQTTTSPYEIIVDKSGYYFTDGKNYTSVSVFLNNNTDEVLYYEGSNCSNQLFNLKPNPYFHLATDICQDNRYTKIALPPHRSQKIDVILTMDKTPDTTVSFGITMKLYK